GELDALVGVERILHDAGDVVEAGDLAILNDDFFARVRVDLDAGRGRDVRQVAEVGAPAHAVRLIQIEDLALDLIADGADAGAALAGDGEADAVLAEDVGELRGDAAADAGAEGADADADRRRADVGEVQRRGVRHGREPPGRPRQAALGLREVRLDARRRAAQRRE